VTNSPIGLLDPTLLPNDGYRLVLSASNAGFTATQPSPLSVSGNYKIGHFRYDTMDLAVPIAGLPISVSRRYNSLDTSVGDFGAGWSLGFNVQVSDVIKEIPGQPEGLRTGSRVYVNRHDGMRVGFTTEVQPSSPWFPWIVSVTFKPDSSHDGELALPGGGLYFREPQTGVLYSDLYLTPLNPDLYTYTADRGLRFDLSESLGLQSVTDLAGNTLTVTPSGIVSSSGMSVAFERDSEGRIIRVVHPVDPNSATPPPDIHYEYDSQGNLARVLNEVNEETLYFYENPNFPHYLTRMEDALGRPLVRNVYDNDGRLVAQCGPGGDPMTLSGCTVFSTDINLGITTIFDGRGNRIDLFIDDFGNVIKERRWTSVSDFVDYNFTFDVDGNMLTEERSPGEIWVFTYDERGNKLSEADPQGRTWTYTYNSCDQLLSSCDPLGHCTVFTHDAQCNLIAIQDPMGRLTTIGYNALGQPVSFMPPVGGAWAMGYDTRGFPASMTDPQGRTEFTVYSNTGQLLSRTDRRGRQVGYVWDSTGKLLREQWDSGLIYDYTRNAIGEVLTVTGPDVNLSYTYDNAGRLEAATASGASYPSITFGYAHDNNDNVTQVTDSLGGATAYTYNALNHLNQILYSIGGSNAVDAAPVVGSTGCRVDITTDQTGLMRTIERYDDLAGSSGAVRTILDYDCTGCARRLNRIRHEDFTSAAAINDIQITRDAASRITEVSDADGVHTYALDGVGRVLSATHTGANPLPNEQYGYDAGGNRIASHLSGLHQYSYATQGVGEELRATSEYSYTYDANGALEQRTHLLSGEVWNYNYDHRNRLVSITHQSSQAVVLNSLSRTYDPADRLATEVINGAAYHYYYDNANPVLILDDQGQVVRRRLYTRYTDQILAEADSTGHRWLLTDQVGSVRDVIAAGGTPLTHYRYDTFGRRMAGGLANDRATLTFNGLEFNSVDGSGHYRARSYLPELGRFAQMDPKFPFGYSFVGSAPLTHSDPSGKTAILEYACFAVGAVFAACSIYSWLSPIGDIFKAVGEFLGDISSAPPDGQALVQAFLESTYYFLVGGLPFSNGPALLGPSCGQSVILTGVGAGANAAIGNPTPLPCQGVFY
jgi:RHS repeat-associated protein